MTRRLIISALPGETRAAWLEDGRLADLIVQRADRPSSLGGLYLGRVGRLDKGLDAAFVEVGLARPGLLPRGEAPGRTLAEGDAIVVRVVREPAGDKGVRLTARITDPPADLAALAKAAQAPALLVAGGDPLARALGAGEPPDEILVDDPQTFAQAKARFLGARPDLVARLRFDADPMPIFEREGIEAEIEALLGPRVDLPSGGVLLIEPASSLAAIDVNSGRHDGRGGAARLVLEVDLEAAREIPRQLRLRALSGLIVVDFLAPGDGAGRRRVVEALRAGLAGDLEPCRVYPMAPSGLVEMTRRRARPALHEVLTEPCGIGGGGRIKDLATLAFDALRAVRRAAATRPDAAVRLRAAPALVAALETCPARRALEERLGRSLVLEADPTRGRDAFEIVLVPSITGEGYP